jgi:prepilin-type N-terminal cleavage/methylation domain-containing protein
MLVAAPEEREVSMSRRFARSGFTIVELLVVLAIAAILMAISMPALLNVAARYKVRSSAQTAEMLARQARYQAIQLGQQVSLVPDPTHSMLYVTSQPAPWSFPNGPQSIAPTQRIAVWEVPNGVTFVATAFSFNSDGSGSGGPMTFSYLNQPSSKVTMVSTATGKLLLQ